MPKTRIPRFHSRHMAAHLAAAHPDLLAPADAAAVINTVFQRMASELAAGRTVRITDFGTFYSSNISSRQVSPPHTRRTFRIPAIRCVRFRSANRLRQAIRAADARPDSRPVDAPGPRPGSTA